MAESGPSPRAAPTANAIARALSETLGVPPFVATAAARAALFHAAFVAAVTVIKSGTNALFLARADAQLLPLLYVAVAVVVALSTSVLARLLSRRSPGAVLSIGIVASALVMIASTAAAALSVRGAPAVCYVLGEATATSGSVLFWARVADGFQVRDQKKVVGLVGAGGMLGAALGGLLIRLIAGSTGVVAPMIAGAVLWVVALPLLRALRSRTERTHKNEGSLLPALKYLVARGYPIAVATLVVLLAATGAATDFVFRTASAAARNEVEMAGLFGMLNAVVGVVVVLFQVSLTSRLLSRVGVFAFVGLVPGLLVAAAVAHVMFPDVFFLLVAMKGIEMAGAYSLNATAVALLYNPMPSELRSQVRTLIDGAIKKSGAAAAGLVLGGLAAFLPVVVGSWLVALVAGGVLVLLPILRARYVDALDDKLGQKKHKPVPFAIDPADRVTRQALRAALLDVDADRVIAALDALGPAYVLSPTEMTALIEHKEERVRTKALRHVPLRSDDHDLTQRLVSIAKNSGPRRPRAEAVRALSRIYGDRAGDVVRPFLDDEEPGVVCATLEAILKRDAHDAQARARLDGLVQGLGARGLAWRRELARLLGSLDDTRYDAALAALIDDEDGTVRALAIDAAGREKHEAHLPLLVAHLGDRRVRPQAMQALARYGDAALGVLSHSLDDKATPLTVRIHVPRVLQTVCTESAARALLFSNPRDDAYLQQRIAAALVNIVKREPGTPIDQRRTDEAIGRRLVAFVAYDDARADLAASDDAAVGLLRRIVKDRRQQNLRIALDLLGIHRGLERMQKVYAGIESGNEAQMHDAMELLDIALAGDALRADFLSLLERKVPHRSLPDALSRVQSLCRSKDPLIRGIARRTAAKIGEDVPEPSARVRVGPGALELEGEDMTETLVERLFLLEHVDLFEGLATDDLAAIAAIAEELSLPVGATLYDEGMSGTQMFVIIEGGVELTRAGRHVMRLRAGESAGQVSFLDRGPRPVTARVDKGPARFLVIEREAFMDLLADRPGLMHAFLGVLAQRLRALIEKEDPGRKRAPTAV